MHRISLLIAALFAAALAGLTCGPVVSNGGDSGVSVDGSNYHICDLRPGQTVCDGTWQVVCDDNGHETSRLECQAPLTCVDGSGCVICHPGQTMCNGNMLMTCRADLMGFEESYECDPNAGETCDVDEGVCANLCDQAAERKANVGCDYIATDLGNIAENSANLGCYVVIVSNIQPEGIAIVTVEDETGTPLDFPGVGTQWHINPGELATIPITGSAGMCSLTPARPDANTMATGLQPGTAFRVKSTLPVVAYQINPYEAALMHTTDAALLIPVPALGDQYIAATYPGVGAIGPASISIVATEDNTVVSINPAANILAGGAVPGGAAPFDVTLNAMEHLQLIAGADLDLMNTIITSTAPVAVYSGALCADIPVGMHWCDHLEEMMQPVNSWGQAYVAAVPPQRGSENALWRIVAAVDNTQVYLEPYSELDRVLNRGEMLEVDRPGSFLVTAMSGSVDPTEPHPIMVVNYLKGAQQTAAETGVDPDDLGTQRGDPAMTLSVPVEQYLDSYVFLSDPSYDYNYVVIVRSDPSQPIRLDCWDPIPESEFVAVSGTYQRAEVTLKNATGTADGACGGWGDVHSISSAAPFGIWVYGYYQDTSYGYPGGMNLEQINDVVIIVE